MEQAQAAMVVGVRFSKVGKIYDFESNGLTDLKVGDMVVVETSRGWQLGTVAKIIENAEPPPDGWKAIDRRATPRDLLLRQMWQQREAEVVSNTKAKAVELRLQGIKIVGAEYSFDGSRLTILFSSETEDKYELKSLRQDMQKVFAPSQVEMRQIGPRDVAKHTCGMGACGLEKRCCCSFLTEFSSISIRMAKEQGISLTPTEITGMCGRLRCCLIYEYETYVEARQTLPKRNKRVRTPKGEGKVIDVAALRGTVIVDLPEVGYTEFPLAEIVVLDENGEPVTAQTSGRPAMSPPEVVEVEHSGPEDGFTGIFAPRPAMDEPGREPEQGRAREERPAREDRPDRSGRDRGQRGGQGGQQGRENRPAQDNRGGPDRGPREGRGGQPGAQGARGPQGERGPQPERGTPGERPQGDRAGRGQRGGGAGRGRDANTPGGQPGAPREGGGRSEGNQRQRGPNEAQRGPNDPQRGSPDPQRAPGEAQPGQRPEAGRGGSRPNGPRRRSQGGGQKPGGGGGTAGGNQAGGSNPAGGTNQAPPEGNQGGQGARRPNNDPRQQHGPRGGRDNQRRSRSQRPEGQSHDSDGNNPPDNTGRDDAGRTEE